MPRYAEACRRQLQTTDEKTGTEECTGRLTETQGNISLPPGLAPLALKFTHFRKTADTGSQLQTVCESRIVQIIYHMAPFCRADSQLFTFALNSAPSRGSATHSNSLWVTCLRFSTRIADGLERTQIRDGLRTLLHAPMTTICVRLGQGFLTCVRQVLACRDTEHFQTSFSHCLLKPLEMHVHVKSFAQSMSGRYAFCWAAAATQVDFIISRHDTSRSTLL